MGPLYTLSRAFWLSACVQGAGRLWQNPTNFQEVLCPLLHGAHFWNTQVDDLELAMLRSTQNTDVMRFRCVDGLLEKLCPSSRFLLLNLFLPFRLRAPPFCPAQPCPSLRQHSGCTAFFRPYRRVRQRFCCTGTSLPSTKASYVATTESLRPSWVYRVGLCFSSKYHTQDCLGKRCAKSSKPLTYPWPRRVERPRRKCQLHIVECHGLATKSARTC